MKESDLVDVNNIDTKNNEKSKITITNNDLEELLNNTKQADQDPTKWLFIVGLEKYKNTDNSYYKNRY